MNYEVMATNKAGVIKHYKEYKYPFVAFKEANKLKTKFYNIAVVCDENSIIYNINGDYFLKNDNQSKIEITGEIKNFWNYKIVDYRKGVNHG